MNISQSQRVKRNKGMEFRIISTKACKVKVNFKALTAAHNYV